MLKEKAQTNTVQQNSGFFSLPFFQVRLSSGCFQNNTVILDVNHIMRLRFSKQLKGFRDIFHSNSESFFQNPLKKYGCVFGSCCLSITSLQLLRNSLCCCLMFPKGGGRRTSGEKDCICCLSHLTDLKGL